MASAFGDPPATPKPPAPSTAEAPADQVAAKPQPRVYGWQLMTEQERADFRAKMRSLKTPEERQAFRRQHHEQMKARAKERGVTLPEEPPMRGPPAGSGMGKGMQQGTPPGPPPGRGQ
jgi:hypothetical protein